MCLCVDLRSTIVAVTIGQWIAQLRVSLECYDYIKSKRLNEQKNRKMLKITVKVKNIAI